MDLGAIERLATALEALETKSMNQKASTVGDVNSSLLLTQPQGLFSVVGMRRDVISTHIQPKGLADVLPAFGASEDDPRYGFVLGFADDIGDEPEFPCDDAPTTYMKGGTLTARFGRIMRDTETIEIDSLLHAKRGVNTDLRLINNMFNPGSNGVGPDLDQAGVLNLVVKNQMVGAGTLIDRKLKRMFWRGALGNDTAGGGYKEFPGLDAQIATGQVDAETNTAMPAADSDIKDFNYNNVAGDGLDIVEYLSMLEYYTRYKAERQNMTPVRWAVVMRPELWFELSAIWPCSYLSHRCSSAGAEGQQLVVINDDVNVRMRDEMRAGMYMDINGIRYPVITDDGIFEKTNVNDENVPAGSYASSIYFVPLTVRGAFPVLYWEHIDYMGVPAQIAPMGQGARMVRFWSENGRLMWALVENSFCFKMQVKIEPRLVLRTPHLAGKLMNVMYSPLQHLVSPWPSDPYFGSEGGVSVRGTSESFAAWGSFTT